MFESSGFTVTTPGDAFVDLIAAKPGKKNMRGETDCMVEMPPQPTHNKRIGAAQATHLMQEPNFTIA
jgi:hypothetical protein